MAEQAQRILVVGARRQERDQLKVWMQQRGHRAWFADGPRGALRIAEEVEPDVVAIDTLLPGAEPERLCRVLQAAYPGIRILFLLNHTFEDNYYTHLAGTTATGVLYRPLDPRDIVGGDPEADILSTLDDITLHGHLDPWHFVEVLLALFRHRKSGLFFVQQDKTRKLLYFLDGRPVYAESNLLSENLGKFLLTQKVITPVQFEWARNLQLNEGIMQGEALVKIGVFTQGDLLDHLEAQIREKFVQAFELRGARFHFEEDRSILGSKQRMTLQLFDLLSQGLARVIWPTLTEDQQRASMAFSLRLHPEEDEALWQDALDAMPTPVLEGLREGAPVNTWMGPDDLVVAWSYAEALCRAGLAEPARILSASECQSFAGWLKRAVTARKLTLPSSVEERVHEIHRIMNEAPEASPHALLGVPFHASPEDIDRRFQRLQAHFGADSYSAGLPMEASMHLAELLELFRDAKERLQPRAGRRRTSATSTAARAVGADEGRRERAITTAKDAIDANLHDQALSSLQEALRHHPGDPDLTAWSAFAQWSAAGIHDATREVAQRQLTALLHRHPTLATAYYLLGRIYEANGDADEAREQYHSALSFDGDLLLAEEALTRLQAR